MASDYFSASCSLSVPLTLKPLGIETTMQVGGYVKEKSWGFMSASPLLCPSLDLAFQHSLPFVWPALQSWEW